MECIESNWHGGQDTEKQWVPFAAVGTEELFYFDTDHVLATQNTVSLAVLLISHVLHKKEIEARLTSFMQRTLVETLNVRGCDLGL